MASKILHFIAPLASYNNREMAYMAREGCPVDTVPPILSPRLVCVSLKMTVICHKNGRAATDVVKRVLNHFQKYRIISA